MHRSGTSAAMRLLQSAGLHVGDELLPPNEDNRVGYFEDVRFVELNRELIAAGLAAHPDVRPRWMYVDRLDHDLLEPFAARARQLVADNASKGALWGFKDPRTSALLEFWDRVASGARYLFLYRPPWEVVDSMFRLSRRPVGGRAAEVVHAWVVYNRSLLGFRREHPNRCLLVHSNVLVTAPGVLVERVNQLLGDGGLPKLGAPDTDSVDSSLLTSVSDTSTLAEVLGAGFPDAARLYRELEEEADLPAVTAASPAGPEREDVGTTGVVAENPGGLPVELVLVGAGSPPPSIAQREVVVEAHPTAGAAANAGVAGGRFELVAVAFGVTPDADALGEAAEIVRERSSRAAVIGTSDLREERPGALHPRELLWGAFEPQVVVLRRSMWQAIGGFDETLPRAGMDGWAAAVALAALGVPLVPLNRTHQARSAAGVLPGAREQAIEHVAARHADFVARQYAGARAYLARQRDAFAAERNAALEGRDKAFAFADSAEQRIAAAERRASSAEQRASDAELRIEGVRAQRDAAEHGLATLKAHECTGWPRPGGASRGG